MNDVNKMGTEDNLRIQQGVDMIIQYPDEIKLKSYDRTASSSLPWVM